MPCALGGDAEELLRQDPLALHRGAAEAHRAGAAAKPRSREEVPAFDQSALEGPDGGELSFEELRALYQPSPVADSCVGSSACDSAPASAPAPAGASQGSTGECSSPSPEAARPTPFDCAASPPEEAAEPPAGMQTAAQATSLAASKIAAPAAWEPPAGACMEPTVTISTRAAFEAINRMFQGSLPHERTGLPPTWAAARSPAAEPTVTLSPLGALEAAAQVFRGQGAGHAGPFRAPAPRPPRHADSTTTPGQQRLMVRRDTELQSGGTPGGLCIREDTQFVSVAALGEQLQQRSGARTPRAPPPLPCGLGVLSDTQFGGFGCTPGTLGGERATPPSTGPGRLCIREDTQFVSVAAVAAAGSSSDALGAHCPRMGGSSCPGSAAGAQVGKWGFAPGADDTLALLSGGAGGGYLPRKLHGLCLSGAEQEEDLDSEDEKEGCKENALGTSYPSRDIHDPEMGAAALQPLLCSHTGGTGEPGYLCLPVSEQPVRDDFVVYQDDQEEERSPIGREHGPHAAGSAGFCGRLRPRVP